MAISTAKQEVDKRFLYGRYTDAEDRRARFAMRVAHKAADLPLEDDVHIDNSRTGFSTGQILGLGAAAGLPGIVVAAILGLALLRDRAPEPAPQAAAGSVLDSEYEVRFYDKDGNLIEVPRISQRP